MTRIPKLSMRRVLRVGCGCSQVLLCLSCGCLMSLIIFLLTARPLPTSITKVINEDFIELQARGDASGN
jgi:hypothetical protein